MPTKRAENGPVINEWYYLSAQGNLFSQFLNGTKINFRFQPVENIQNWVKNWNPWALIDPEDWKARKLQTEVIYQTF